MNRTPAIQKLVTRLVTSGLLIATVAMTGAVGNGCAYGGVAALPDGRVVVMRNSLLGALRKVYFCKVEGNELQCIESPSAP
jgi:hypothetical protein